MLTSQPRSSQRTGAITAVVLLHLGFLYVVSHSLDVVKMVKPLESMVTVFVPDNKPTEKPPEPQLKLPDASLNDIKPPDVVPEITPEVAVAEEPSGSTISTAPTDASAIPTTKSFSIKTRVDPPYPPASRRAGEQGTVLLEIIVAPSGVPTEVNVARSSGYSALDDAAVAAVRKWRFSTNSGSNYARLQLPVTFKLENAR